MARSFKKRMVNIMADINGVERTYANKDVYDWEGGEYDDGEVETAMIDDCNELSEEEYEKLVMKADHMRDELKEGDI